jgi:transcriptional regulator with XRE-family HTH domain
MMISNSATFKKLYPFELRRGAIRQCRVLACLTQAELARKAKLSQSKISAFESGAQDLSAPAMRRVEEVLDQEVACRQMTSLASLRGQAQQVHNFHLFKCKKTGAFVVEYQADLGMPVCEEYRFSGSADLLEFVDHCIHCFKHTRWFSDLPPLGEDED